jgi:alkylhydroperoxidase/carboxymuconolactone decarboxylase family protein YurZ
MPSETEELIVAIILAARVGPTATPELRDAIQTYVRGLKASGYRPEEVLAAIRALIAEAGVEKRRGSADSPHEELADRVVAWCIEAYFPPAHDAG